MASNLNVNDNGFRASKLLVDGGGYLAKQILLQKAISGTVKTIDGFLADINVKQTITKLQSKRCIHAPQYAILYPPNGNPTNLDEWDITLVTLILKNCLTLSLAENIAIQEIRDLRNSLYGHTAKVEMTDTEFKQNWKNISSKLIKHSKLLTKPKSTSSIQEMINTVLTQTLSADKAIETLKLWYVWGMDVEKRLEDQTVRLNDITHEQTSSFKDITRDQTVRLEDITHDQTSRFKVITDDQTAAFKDITYDQTGMLEDITLDQTARFENITDDQTARLEDITDDQTARLVDITDDQTVRFEDITDDQTVRFEDIIDDQTVRFEDITDDQTARLEDITDDQTARLVDITDDQTAIFEDITHDQTARLVDITDDQTSIFEDITHDQTARLVDTTDDQTAIFEDITHNQTARLEDITHDQTAIIKDITRDQTSKLREAETKSYRRHREIQDKLFDIKVSQRKVPNDFILKLDKYYKEQNVDRTELNRRIRQAKNILDIHRRDLKRYGFPYKTRMTEHLTQKLKEHKILVLKGVQGSGKTHLAKNVLVNFMSFNPEISPLIIRTPSEIDRVLDPTGSFVLLVDDMIGTNSFDAIEFKDWFQYIETLVSQVEVGTLFVVITIRTSIYRQCQSGKLSKLFENANVIDERDYLLEYEKETIFRSFAKYHNVGISGEQIKLIVQQKSVGIGVPLLCRMMKGHDVNKLFQSPINYLKTEMLRIKEDVPVSFVVLFMTLVGNGLLSKTSLTENQMLCFETLQNLFKTSPMDLHLIYKTAKSFAETYFNFDETEFEFSFIHETIRQSIFEAALEFIPHILIQYCPFDTLISNLNLISETITTEEEKPNPYLVHKQHIIERMRSVMCSSECASNIGNIASAYMWNNRNFAEDAIRKFELTHVYQEDDEGVSMICHFASLGLEYILKIIVSRSTPVYKSGRILDQIQKALGQSCLADKQDCVEYLILKCKEIRSENVFAAVKGGNIEIIKLIIAQFGKGKINTLRQDSTKMTIFHVAAEVGRLEIVKYLHQLCPQMLQEEDAQGWTVIHFSAKCGKTECLKYFLQNGIDGNDLTQARETLLHIAAEGGHIETIQFILERYPNMVKMIDFHGRNIAHSAAGGGNIECFRFLIEMRVDPKQKASNGTTILHTAAAAGNLNLLVYICQTYEDLVQETDDDGFNFIYYAAFSSLECMQYVIKKYKNVLHLTHGITILHLSSFTGNMSMVKYISDTYPSLLQLTDNAGRNALHHAAQNGTDECLKYLVEHELNPRDKTGDGETILHQAALGGNMNTLTFICETYPGLLQLTDNYGRNALHSAAKKGTLECLKCLVYHGLVPKNKTREGETILHQAALGGNMKTTKYICETYPDLLQLKDNYGKNVLHNAAELGNVECLKYLVENGINPRAITGDGGTLLHRAALGTNISALTYVCETYPELLQLTNTCGRNALHYAAHTGAIECFKYLVDHGLNPRDKSGEGVTILHQAALGGNMNTLAYICETYPDLLLLTDNDGNNSLKYAAGVGTVECLKYLVDHGLNPKDITEDGITILHLAALGGNINTLPYICETYPELLHLIDNNGRNVLHNAAHKGTVKCLKYLVDQGLNPKEKTEEGITMLHLAALGGNINTLIYICETYPELLQCIDNNGRNATHSAAEGGNVKCLKYLVDRGLNPKNKTEDGATILHHAALGGNINTLKYIYQTYPELLQLIYSNGRNVLHHAAHKGTVECLQYLVDQGLNPTDKTEDGDTILHLAALGGNMSTMTYICETYPELLQLTKNEGSNILHDAAEQGNVECLKYLVENGINPRDITEEGYTILHRAALGKNISTLTHVCEAYPDLLQLTDIYGGNALYLAAQNGSVKCLKYLVDHGLNPKDKTGDGVTILNRAALGGNMNTLTYICETYPDLIQLTDNYGRNALHAAAHKGTVDCFNYLLDRGFNPRDKSGNGDTILLQAALGGNMHTLPYIYETYPDLLHLIDNNGRNALHNAAHKGTVECLKYLVEHELNPRKETGHGMTILHLAALGGNINTMKYICETYPDLLQLTDNYGQNALHSAAHRGNVQLFKYLVEHGLNPRDKTGDGETILHRAALGGNMRTLTYICETYPDLIQLTESNGTNALYYAMLHIMELLNV